MARQLKELRSLMPWTWDSRLDSHPPGEAAMRDFEDCHSWTRAPRRHAASPAVHATPSRKRGSRVQPSATCMLKHSLITVRRRLRSKHMHTKQG